MKGISFHLFHQFRKGWWWWKRLYEFPYSHKQVIEGDFCLHSA